MDYSAANTSLWNFVIQLGIVAILVALSNILKRTVPFFRKSLLPTAVLAGFLLLILRNLNILRIDNELLSMVTYHGIAIGFIAMSLRVKHKEPGKGNVLLASKSGALIVSTYLVQSLVGLFISIVLAATVMPDLFPAAGALLPMGYGQGPGQANNIGSSYEALGFTGGRSFGLAIAAAGYLCACLVGIIYMNVLVKQGRIARRKATGTGEEVLSLGDFRDQDEIPISESIDLLSIQLALIFICYLITYLLCKAVADILPSLASIFWGFNFVFGSLIASLLARGLKALRDKGLMKRQYQNNYLLARLSGFAFDLMIIGGIASIDIEDLSGLWLPFCLMAISGGVSTFFYLRFLCKKLYPTYAEESFFGMYGMLTGTISSGILLIRELDPDLQTPASMDLVTGSSFAIAFGAPMLLLVGMAPSQTGLTCILVVLYLALLLFYLLRFNGFKKKGH